MQLSMLGGGAILSWAPAYSSALPHAVERWRERGGLLVVPRREAAARVLLDEAAGGAAVIGREAVTFAGLRGRVAAAAGVDEPQPPSAIEVRLALREVLDAADLSAFGDSARAPGFLSAIERAIGELRAARVPPARAAAAAATPVAAAVAAIHAAAWETVPVPSDALWRVADAAAAVAWFPPVTVSGFDDLVPGQWALLRALAQVARVEVVMPFDPARPAFEARRERQALWSRGTTVERARRQGRRRGRPGWPPASSTRSRRRTIPPACDWSARPAPAGCCGRPSRRPWTRRPGAGCRSTRWRWWSRDSPSCATTSSACSTTGRSRRASGRASAPSRRRSRWR